MRPDKRRGGRQRGGEGRREEEAGEEGEENGSKGSQASNYSIGSKASPGWSMGRSTPGTLDKSTPTAAHGPPIKSTPYHASARPPACRPPPQGHHHFTSSALVCTTHGLIYASPLTTTAVAASTPQVLDFIHRTILQCSLFRLDSSPWSPISATRNGTANIPPARPRVGFSGLQPVRPTCILILTSFAAQSMSGETSTPRIVYTVHIDDFDTVHSHPKRTSCPVHSHCIDNFFRPHPTQACFSAPPT